MVSVRLSRFEVRKLLLRWSIAKFIGQAFITVGLIYALGQAGNYDYELAIQEVSEITCGEVLLGTIIPCGLMVGGAWLVERSCKAVKFYRGCLMCLSEFGE